MKWLVLISVLFCSGLAQAQECQYTFPKDVVIEGPLFWYESSQLARAQQLAAVSHTPGCTLSITSMASQGPLILGVVPQIKNRVLVAFDSGEDGICSGALSTVRDCTVESSVTFAGPESPLSPSSSVSHTTKITLRLTYKPAGDVRDYLYRGKPPAIVSNPQILHHRYVLQGKPSNPGGAGHGTVPLPGLDVILEDGSTATCFSPGC